MCLSLKSIQQLRGPQLKESQPTDWRNWGSSLGTPGYRGSGLSTKPMPAPMYVDVLKSQKQLACHEKARTNSADQKKQSDQSLPCLLF